jgi:type I site-specific restriction-modification system R (restriction) subunit
VRLQRCRLPPLAVLKDYILFAEKDEELQKFILHQHQTAAVAKVVERCLTADPKPEKRRGLVWHTQGSGKTFTMIKTAELLFKAAAADKPTVLLANPLVGRSYEQHHFATSVLAGVMVLVRRRNVVRG